MFALLYKPQSDTICIVVATQLLLNELFLFSFCSMPNIYAPLIHISFISNYLEFLSDIGNIWRRFFHCHDLVCGACNLTAISPSQFQPSLPADYHSAVKWHESKTNERKRSLNGMVRKFNAFVHCGTLHSEKRVRNVFC